MAITCSRSIISIFLVANVSENFERNSVNVADMVLISSFPSTTVAFCICNSEESLNIIFNFFSFPVRHRTKIGAGGSWLTGYILISVAALNRKTIAEYDTLWTNAVIMRQGSRRTINFHYADIASKITLPEKDRPYHDRGACASVYNGGSVAVLIVRKNGEIAVSNQYGTIASGGIYGQIEYDV